MEASMESLDTKQTVRKVRKTKRGKALQLDDSWTVKALDEGREPPRSHIENPSPPSPCSPPSPDTHHQNIPNSRNIPISQFLPNGGLLSDQQTQVAELPKVEKSESGSSSFVEGVAELQLLKIDKSELDEDKKSSEGYRSESTAGSGSRQMEVSDSAGEADNVLSRLEELAIGVEEPELSEEQRRINDQLQLDELLVLEAIYGDNVYILNRKCGQRSFQIYIHNEVPDDFTVSAKLYPSSVRFKSGENSKNFRTEDKSVDEFLYTFKVQHLPPIMLTCILPESYPSHLYPRFIICVQWLDALRISSLCSMLDLIWNEQPGQEVLFRWVVWLKSSSLSYLEVDKEIMLGPYVMPLTGDRRAVSGSVSPDADIPLLMSYNDEKCNEEFRKNFQECSICFSEYAGNLFLPGMHSGFLHMANSPIPQSSML